MFGMSFLAPFFLAGAIAAAIPIVLHLFHRRAEPLVEFAAMRYLRQAPVEQSQRRRMRELILLALRVTALLLMALAFARPYLASSSAALANGATIVLVDTSASVTAPGQFERVRQRATDVVKQAPATHAVAVLTFAQATEVVAPLSRDRSVALAAVSRLAPSAGATRYRAALRRAGEELNGREGRVVVISDLQESGWDATSDAAIPDNVVVTIDKVEAPPANAAVAALRVEAGEAVATVANFSSVPLTEQVLFVTNDRRVGSVPITVPPAAVADARLPLPVTTGTLKATITDGAGFKADNERYAILNGDSGISVLVVTASGNPAEALYLERALMVAGGAGGFAVRSLAGGGVGALDQASFDAVDVIAVLGSRGLDQRGRQRLSEFVDSGGGLLVAAGPDVEPGVLRQSPGPVIASEWRGREVVDMRFAPADSRHPVFRPFGGVGTLGNVRFSRAAQFAVADEATVIASYSDGTPAVVEERRARGRILLFASDLNYRWNDFPLQPAFVPFVHETVRYLAGARATRTEYVVGELVGQAQTPGVVRIGERDVAINVDPRESNPAAMTAEAFADGVTRMQVAGAQQARAAEQQREDGQGLWRYGLLLMLLTLAGEGLLGRRLG